MVEAFFTYGIFKDIVFPFVLVFTLLFAILEKTKVVGENKQNHALISLAVSLIFIAVPSARQAVVGLAPFFAVLAVVLLIFLILYGFVLQGEVKITGTLQTILILIIAAAVIVAVLASTGYWPKLVEFVKSEKGVVVNALILIIMAAAAFVVVKYAK